MNRYLPAFAGALVVFSVAGAADASPLLFQLSGSRDATFQLDSNPTPDFFSSSFLGSQIQFFNVAGTFGGVAGNAASIGFGTGPILAQLNIDGTSLGFTQFGGPDLFSGTAASPVFAPGTFALTSIVSGASTLRISAIQPVPEPSTWPVLLGGIGMLGVVVQLRRRDATGAHRHRRSPAGFCNPRELPTEA